ncbi:hypothetical protein CEXT_690881 [Caerostris extrusa]|uniref:Uncharacterized protein n=1 Tax=Caerostris extrusa TaxID=172846 RepID=A0AAV4Y6P8_CAEEX|nr:hypothetical protein CEXT_690881 [Caerostris extrusa]
MESVDQALLLSGFRIKIEGNDDPAYNSKIHVDYAVARDDQHDYACQQRALIRKSVIDIYNSFEHHLRLQLFIILNRKPLL